MQTSELVGGQLRGVHIADADRTGDLVGWCQLIAGDQRDLDAEITQRGDRVCGIGLERISDRDESGDPAIDCDEQSGGTVEIEVEQRRVGTD